MTCPAQPLLSGAKNSSCVVAAVQDLSSAFFAQEVLERERALGDARASLAALCDKLAEMSAERDEVWGEGGGDISLALLSLTWAPSPPRWTYGVEQNASSLRRSRVPCTDCTVDREFGRLTTCAIGNTYNR